MTTPQELLDLTEDRAVDCPDIVVVEEEGNIQVVHRLSKMVNPEHDRHSRNRRLWLERIFWNGY